MMPPHEVLVIGAGFAGLAMAIELRRRGIHDFVVLERGDSVGGVWRDNVYPGVACDVPVHLYSYSFEPSPTWSRFFAPQREILAYLERCADKYGVRPHLHLREGVKRATFDEARRLWTVETTTGRTLEAKVVVAAAGLALTQPVLPEIPGLDRFEGHLFHSARWDTSYDLTGKRVAVIGTGASAAQIVPSIAPVVAGLHVFQRTAPWVLPRLDRPIGPRQQALFARVPAAQKALRAALYGVLESFAVGFVVDPRINRVRERFVRRFLERSVRDPALRKKVTPTFTLGCKRLLFSNDWYPALQERHVELVTEAITEVSGRSILTADGRTRDVDAIVCATGFEASEARPSFELRGRGGRTLGGGDGTLEAYLGASVRGFPNFFILLGPNTGLGHSSMILMIESQVAYVMSAVETMRAKGLRSVEVREDVQRRYNERLQERLARTVWATGGCASWYRTPDGKNTTLWPGFTFEFRLKTRRFDEGAYEVS